MPLEIRSNPIPGFPVDGVVATNADAPFPTGELGREVIKYQPNGLRDHLRAPGTLTVDNRFTTVDNPLDLFAGETFDVANPPRTLAYRLQDPAATAADAARVGASLMRGDRVGPIATARGTDGAQYILPLAVTDRNESKSFLFGYPIELAHLDHAVARHTVQASAPGVETLLPHGAPIDVSSGAPVTVSY